MLRPREFLATISNFRSDVCVTVLINSAVTITSPFSVSTPVVATCSSNVILTGVNSNEIMSGCGDDNPDDARREADRDNPRMFRGELAVGSAAVLPGISEHPKR